MFTITTMDNTALIAFQFYTGSCSFIGSDILCRTRRVSKSKMVYCIMQPEPPNCNHSLGRRAPSWYNYSMKRGKIIIPDSPLDFQLSRLARLKLQAWAMLAELEQSAGFDIEKSGNWRHNPTEWIKRTKS